jgi:uroporphyrinogen decarboxylase
MDAKRRFLEVATFGDPDRTPLAIGEVRPLTRRRWVGEGLPENMSILDYLDARRCTLQSVSLTAYPQQGREWKPSSSAINLGPIPPFEQRIISEDERYRVWVDSLGITQKGLQDDWSGGWSGFATRVFIDFPVKNRRDFEEIKKRYDPKDPGRYPENWDEVAEAYERRSHPICINIRGPFWWTRDMVGLKGLAIMIHRDPELIHDIMELCAEFHVEALERCLETVEVDYVIMSEDMAYKKGPMIGPDAARRFMESPYRRMVSFFRGYGVKIVGVDSDGNVEPLIPFWLSVGINCITPCEAAAGIDVAELGRKYPSMVMIGGLDKRELAKGKEAVRREVMRKVPQLVERRGYFPGVDHAVPPDVPLENYVYFVSLLKRICGWESGGEREK